MSCNEFQGQNVYVILRMYPDAELREMSTTHGVFPTRAGALKKFEEYIANGLTGQRRTETQFYGKDAGGNVVILLLNEHTLLPLWMFEE